MAIVLVHGKEDATIPSRAPGATDGQLKTAGYDKTLDIGPRRPHHLDL
ncbi:hypothetical protein [Rhizobium sp. L245/93]|nr:hypothetical protein [Rhizobium sp. L245/93]MBO9171563.1 hypothetical protein [Rhizobium sp. L245/93]